jgi:methylglutaconyl-CoA hydratase
LKFLKITENQHIATVSLDRPEKRNAFHPGMIGELTKFFKATAKDKKLRGVLLTGEGASFCAGGDLEWMKEMASYSKAENRSDAKRLYEMYWLIKTCPVPVVGKIFGHAFGGGAGLTAVCDIVFAEEKTQFCFSEVKYGLVPAVISPFVNDRACRSFIPEWFLTAKVFSSAEASRGGLINKYGTLAEVDSYVEDTLKLILNSAPEAVRETKKLQQMYSTVPWKKMEAVVTKLIAARRASAEGQKGLSAFLAKTTPRWSESPYGSPPKI